MPELRSDPIVRLLGAAGAFGGFIWAGVMLAAGLTFFGIDLGVFGFGELVELGALFTVIGLAVPLMLGGAVGVHRFAKPTYGEPGRIGSYLSTLGFLLLLPGSLVPSGALPGLTRYTPVVFFAGLIAVAIGSAVVGFALRRSGVLPGVLSTAYGVAMPGGAALGGIVALAGVGNIAFVLGLTVPYGVSWVALGGYLAFRT